ncbi:MAG: UbiA family prenyltransferase [Thermoplasmata archaeon]
MAFLKLIRPLNVMLAAGAVFIGSFVAMGTDVAGADILIPVLLACLAAGLVTGAGNVLNDYSDRDTDRVNHPERPIPSGQVSPKSALSLSVVMFLLSLPLAFLINVECFLLAGLNVLVLVSYERSLKRKGFLGNVEVSWLTGSIFIFGGFAAYNGDFNAFGGTFFLALLAFFASLGREIAKDIQDIDGDVDRMTLPKRIGVKKASRSAAFFFLVAVLLSFEPPFFNLLNFYYLPIVIVADIIFIYSSTLLTRNPQKASSLAKMGMMMALLAFVIGGFT